MYELKTCSVCGASGLKRIDTEQHDGQAFGVYKCPSCDAELSAYDKYLKTVKAARANQPEPPTVAEEPEVAPAASQPMNRTAIVNIAADVYQKAIGSTLQLIAKMDDSAMSGTGTMISDKGYFITNAHVVMELSQNHQKVLNLSDAVYGQSGERNYRFVAELICANPAIDLALLKTEPNSSLKPVTFADQEAFPGEAVYAIGNSKGEGLCIVEGIVSDVHRRIGNIDAIMISAPVTHGNSGGPVFDAEGKLVGIVQSGRQDVSAMNYVIPIKTINEFLQKAKEKENLDF